MVTVRKVPLVTRQIYHIFNRGIDKRTTFSDQLEYLRFYQTIRFYRFSGLPVDLSKYLKVSQSFRDKLDEIPWGPRYVYIYAYCFMPNHFHLVVEQGMDGGISKFMSLIQNSYTRYFNTRHERVGQLFLDQFKNVLVESEEQLLHVSRYVHLNPYSSNITKTLNDLQKYEWSSLNEYTKGGEDPICTKSIIMSYFKSRESYKKFVFDRADYQRDLKTLEHLLIED